MHLPFSQLLRQRWFFLLVALGLSLQVASAQNYGSVSGTILDGQTKQPLGFATIFIAQTTYGTTAAENGTFTLTAIPAGTHELVVSFLGYETLSHSFVLQPGQQQQFRFELAPKANQLQEVVVGPDPHWKSNFATFVQNFIGKTANAAQTEVVNADVLHFTFDPDTRVFTAEASAPLVIENKALGYRVHFLLEVFELDYRTSRVFHAGFPRFEAMKPKNKGQQARWEKARLKAYQGSMMHFGRALYNKNLEAEGFQVRKLKRVPNPSRPPEEEIQAGLRRARARLKGTVVISANPQGAEDSLSYWARMNRLDKQVAYLYKDPVPYDQLVRLEAASGQTVLQFTDFLNVVYAKEKEELGYVNQNLFGKKRAPGPQTSLITLTEPSTFLEPNGMIINPYSHVVEGYWAYEKLAEMLPLDYQPAVQ
ncbi:carboxypeptidase-like regulatory domain-containing protein [Rufibacter quisquiliarum]|uniref:Carboxypeptidase-like regulatory domain-containing protein n=1 Tax=Rufibacter quisquiliarum TaxID=1549639 RepID=A0A839GIK9_9BACT|nr:carboxypeptidase-like regulatory domain-containing protein [Rufibacter quisquiliarum]MBA9078460.1 hypothetical protein [Rufibacter quisquiliarum]